MPVGHHCTIAAEKFIKEAEKRSNGTLKFTYYPAGQLAMDVKAFQMCQRGGIEMAQFFTNRAVGLVPEVDLTVPYFDDPDTFARRMWDIAGGGGLFYKYLRPKFAQHGLYLLPGFMYSPEHSSITAKKPVHKMADYKGLKIRVSGRSLGVAVDSWGAKSVVMSSSEVYMALQRGTIDGANSGLTTFRSRKWYEVARHIQLLWEFTANLDMIANLKWWKSLTPEQRNAIEEALRVTAIWSWERAIKSVDEDIKFFKSKGLEVFDFLKSAPEEREKMKEATIAALEKKIRPTVGEAAWNDNLRMINAAKKGTRTWKEIMQSMKW
jgi:TRAP-type C4-dicarboxylate transport system substrate-binding protein